MSDTYEALYQLTTAMLPQIMVMVVFPSILLGLALRAFKGDGNV